MQTHTHWSEIYGEAEAKSEGVWEGEKSKCLKETEDECSSGNKDKNSSGNSRQTYTLTDRCRQPEAGLSER